MKEANQRIIRPQANYQEAYLSTPADIAIGGGSAGAGKTYSLLLESIRNYQVKGFGGVIFRRTTPQITNEGGLWDTASHLYPYVGGKPNLSSLSWKFPQDTKIKFSHLEYDKNALDWQGTQIAFIGFDELTHFTKYQFLYLLSRNRSTCGVKPYIRATCNPDPDSWVAEFLEWWIDQETGFPIPERSGVLRYFISDAGHFVWGDSKQEVIEKAPHIFSRTEFAAFNKDDLIKSVTFIPGSIYDNKKLLEVNPEYLGSLLALDEQEQSRLLSGNWKIRQDGSALFNYVSITNLFSNFAEASEEKYITCDYAREGKDFTVIFTWLGYGLVRIEVMTKSSTVEAFTAIEKERERVKIPRSNVAVDEGGVGGGVIDLSNGEYRGFISNATALPNPITKIKENYKDLKTQCYYRYADLVNAGKTAIKLDNVIVDGEQTTQIKIGSKFYDVRKLISDDLRAIKKKNMDMDNKKQINSKEEQKIILGGRSPDFSDAASMRSLFDLERKIEPSIRWL